MKHRAKFNSMKFTDVPFKRTSLTETEKKPDILLSRRKKENREWFRRQSSFGSDPRVQVSRWLKDPERNRFRGGVARRFVPLDRIRRRQRLAFWSGEDRYGSSANEWTTWPSRRLAGPFFLFYDPLKDAVPLKKKTLYKREKIALKQLALCVPDGT